jgi:hypothetical protein
MLGWRDYAWGVWEVDAAGLWRGAGVMHATPLRVEGGCPRITINVTVECSVCGCSSHGTPHFGDRAGLGAALAGLQGAVRDRGGQVVVVVVVVHARHQRTHMRTQHALRYCCLPEPGKFQRAM